MRAGAFSDDRVIHLLNRRFVPYFYNRSGKGCGGNAAAAAFTRGKTKNPYAFLAAFTADGRYLGETELYADKDEVFAWLRTLLRDHPEFARATAAEEEALAAGGAAAARMREELGDLAEAAALWADVAGPEARRAEARIARYLRDWPAHEAAVARIDADTQGDDVAAERGYRLVADEDYAGAARLLRAALHRYPESPRRAEMHFSAGVACWFLGQRDWARFHWMWVVENLPDDRLSMRCRVAAAAEIMPYANPELKGFKARGMIGTEHIVREVARAREDYRRLLPKWQTE